MRQDGCALVGFVKQLACQTLAHRAKGQIFDQHHQVAQLAGHLAQRRQRQVGVFANKLEQRGAWQQQAIDLAHRAGGGRAGVIVEQRHGVEVLARADHGQHLLAAIRRSARKPHPAAAHEEQTGRLLAFQHNVIARAKIAALDLARDIGQRLRIQSGEKWDVAKFVWCYHNRQYTTARRRFVRYNAGLIVRSGEESRFLMQRTFSIFVLAALLAGCAGPQVANSPTATTAPVPTTTPAPTAPPTAAPSPTLAATAPATAVVPTVPPTVPPATAAPTAPATQPPTATAAAPPATAIATPAAAAGAGPTLPDTPLDLRAQAKALLPDLAGDLDRAGEWNRYTISAAIDPQARTITGRERIEYTNRDSVALDRLYFHLYPNLPDFAGSLDVSALTVDGQPGQVAYERQRYLLRVDLPQPLAPGATSTVAFDFRTAAPQNASADFYGAFNKENGVLGLASSYPIAAIVRGGVWDIGLPDGRGDFVNSETALYDVTLTAPADWSLATTGVVLDGRLDAGQQTVRIVSGPQRDFMIAATQLQIASADVDGTKINSYFRAEHAQAGQLALQAACRLSTHLQRALRPLPTGRAGCDRGGRTHLPGG